MSLVESTEPDIVVVSENVHDSVELDTNDTVTVDSGDNVVEISASATEVEILPASTVQVESSSIQTVEVSGAAAYDAVYLRLDASNDPITGDLLFSLDKKACFRDANKYIASTSSSFLSVVSDVALSLSAQTVAVSAITGLATFIVSATNGAFFYCPAVIDKTASEAFLVRKAGDTGDVFAVDTSDPRAFLYGYLLIDKNSDEALNVRKAGDQGDIFIVDTNNSEIEHHGATICDLTNAEAFLVRKNLDAGDVFAVDTSASETKFDAWRKLGHVNGVADLLYIRGQDNLENQRDIRIGLYNGFGKLDSTTSVNLLTWDFGVKLSTDREFTLGTSNQSKLRYSSSGNDALMIGVNDQAAPLNRTAILCDVNDVARDFGRAVESNPTLYIWSAVGTDLTQWVKLQHNQTDALIQTGKGDIQLSPVGYVRFGTHQAIGAETLTGYITIKDSGGTLRKVAVVS